MDWGSGGPERRRTCMLIITHACNLNCSYCYETHKGNACMDASLAKEIISREAQFVSESDDFDEIDIDFMGGEPFMNFPLIKEIVEWLETGVISVPWICSATTNGTLLTDEIKKWLREHKDSFVPGASYDGTGTMQSTNRGTDKYNVDLDFFQKTWPFQPLHMTISKETLPNLAEGVLYIQKKGYKVEGALAEGVNWTLEDAVLYRKQLCILKETYLKNTKLTPFNRLTGYMNVFNLPAAERPQEKWCGTGKGMAAYDINGRKYGCHMFAPIVLGENGALLADAVEWEAPESTADEYCKNCVLRRICPTCPGFNYRYRGHIALRDKSWCPMILAEVLTSCEFQIERIAAIDKLDEQDAQHGKAAFEACKILQNLDLEKSKSPYTV